MHKRQKQFNPSCIKWPTEVDMLLNKTQTQTFVYHHLYMNLSTFVLVSYLCLFIKFTSMLYIKIYHKTMQILKQTPSISYSFSVYVYIVYLYLLIYRL